MIDVKLVHLVNAHASIILTDGGMMIDVKLVHPSNADSQISVTDDASITPTM